MDIPSICENCDYRDRAVSPKDVLNYHEVVALVESLRPDSPKMVNAEPDRSIEKIINKLRVELRKLKKGE